MWQPPSAWGRKLGWVQICINSLVEPQTSPLVTGFGCPGLEGERWIPSQKHSSLQSLLFSDITFPAGFLCQAEQQNLQYSCLKEIHEPLGANIQGKQVPLTPLYVYLTCTCISRQMEVIACSPAH